MAINLSRSFAKPCDILCDLTVDDVAIPELTVMHEKGVGAIVATFGQQAPSIKYNGDGYTCRAIGVKSPSFHTIEDIRGDAEMIAVCENPAGKYVFVSVLLRTNTGDSRMKSMLNSFVPYANTEHSVRTNLGENWSLTAMVPPEPAYYTYRGTPPWRGPVVQWVVFRSMGNIDPNDFAMLTRVAGSVPTPISARTQEVFFNDIQHIAGVPDGKAYMRCKRVKKRGEEVNRVTPVKGLEVEAAKKATEEDKHSWGAWLQDTVKENGGWANVILMAAVGAAVLLGLWYAYGIIQGDTGLTLARTAQDAARGLRTGVGSAAAQATTLAKVASAKATNLALEGAKKSSALAAASAAEAKNIPTAPAVPALTNA